MGIRFVTIDDTESILEIYSQYIDTAITFECSLPSIEEFTKRIMDISRDYPYLVYEQEGKIAGYAYAHRLKEREAYQWDAELSVYMDKRFTGKGIGTKLYNTIIDILKLQEIRTIYAGITDVNEESRIFHEKFCFTLVGTYHKTGYKNNAWHDVSWFEKQIGGYNDTPKPFVPINKLPKSKLLSLL